jgi:uncharacterized protein GlcG (DUF336 family)
MSLTLDTCRTLADAVLATGREKGMKPLGVVIVDARGAVRLVLVEDGNAPLRADIAHGKAYGCAMVGVGGRALERMAKDRPHFVNALGGLTRDRHHPGPRRRADPRCGGRRARCRRRLRRQFRQ